MTKIVMMEGNTAVRRAQAEALGVRNCSEIYRLAIAAHHPEIELDIINGADEEANARTHNWDFADYDGFVITGSALHAYDTDYSVTNQIALVRQAGESGIPIFGSCWGLQIAVMAAGGEVVHNPKGCEVGVARKICVNAAGAVHPMFAGKPPVFDAPCIHYDEVLRLPSSAKLLASNAHSHVQAVELEVGRSQVWAVQYHPEYDLKQLAHIYTLYGEAMVEQGFFADLMARDRYRDLVLALHEKPQDKGLAWQLGIESDITDDTLRRRELLNWLEHIRKG